MSVWISPALVSLPGGRGGLLQLTLCWWLFHCTACSPLGKPVGASSSGQGEEAVSTSVAAGDCVK